MQFVPCHKDNKKYLISQEKLCHAYSSPTTGTNIVTKDHQTFYTDLSLKVLEYNTLLTQCHRKHLINPDCIKFIERLENGLGSIYTDHCSDTIPVSRNYMNNFGNKQPP